MNAMDRNGNGTVEYSEFLHHWLGVTRHAKLSGQVHLVVGAINPVYQGLVSRLLDSGSVVVAPSANPERIEMLQESLGYPAGLVTIEHSMCTDQGAAEVARFLMQDLGRLDGVVAHGGLLQSQYDPMLDCFMEKPILESSTSDVMSYVQNLLNSHVNTATTMVPLLNAQESSVNPSYTIVTGGLIDGRPNQVLLGAQWPAVTSMYGFGLALRAATRESRVRVNEIRIGMELNRSEEERMEEPRTRPLSLDIGALATYVAESEKRGQRLRASDNAELEGLLHHFGAFQVDCRASLLEQM